MLCVLSCTIFIHLLFTLRTSEVHLSAILSTLLSKPLKCFYLSLSVCYLHHQYLLLTFKKDLTYFPKIQVYKCNSINRSFQEDIILVEFNFITLPYLPFLVLKNAIECPTGNFTHLISYIYRCMYNIFQ